MLVAHVWLVAIRRLEYKAPSNQNVRYHYLPSLDLVQRELVVFLLITKSPILLYNQGLMGSISSWYTTMQAATKAIYRLRNVRAGYVLYRALVLHRI